MSWQCWMKIIIQECENYLAMLDINYYVRNEKMSWQRWIMIIIQECENQLAMLDINYYIRNGKMSWKRWIKIIIQECENELATLDKPFQCTECNKTFESAMELWGHQVRLQAPYTLHSVQTENQSTFQILKLTLRLLNFTSEILDKM